MHMTDARINAIVASAYNNLAVSDVSLRATYPNGMRPADAALLDKQAKQSLLAQWDGSADGLYTPADVQQAIKAL